MHQKSKSGLALLIGLGGKPPQRDAPPKMDEEESPYSISKTGEKLKYGAQHSERFDTGDITPEMVSYRTADQVCGNCRHMQGENCELLGISVASGDSCHAYSEREGGHEEQESQPEVEVEEEIPE